MDAEEYNRLYKQLFSFVYGMLHNTEVAEDIVQDSFEKLFKSGKTFESPAKRYKYLKKTARTTVFDYQAGKNVRRNDKFHEQVLYPHITPEQEAAAKVKALVIQLFVKWLDSFPEEERQIALQILLENREIKEVAGEMGKKDYVVRDLKNRILASFTEYLKSMNIEIPEKKM